MALDIKKPVDEAVEDIDNLEKVENPDYAKYHRVGLSQDDIVFMESIPKKEQDRIFRKVDWRLVPLLSILYLLSHLDR